MTSLLLIILVMAVVPYAVLGDRRPVYAVLDAASYGAAAAIWWVVPALELPLDTSLAFALLFATKLALFLVFLAAPQSVPRWNENWAAAFAAAIYLSLIPHVLQWPIDGDEPFYLLVTESLIEDGDFDLRNQYAQMASSATRRPDLRPQLGDPVGAGGEQYSRTEPFLSLLILPGFLMFGLPGAVATVALFGALLVRSTLLLLREEGVPDRAGRIWFGFLAFGPPILFYSVRIWPEVPAAWLFVEALRALRGQRPARFVGAIAALSLLKLRFILLAVGLLAALVIRDRRRWKVVAIALALVFLPLLIAFTITGQWLNVHQLWELQPGEGWAYARGLFGLLLDARAGILFQASFYFLGILALFRWHSVPAAARIALWSSVLYLILLLPRAEWHGGWAPPLRYLVFLFPVFCLAGGRLAERIAPAPLLFLALPTAALTIHGTAYPWRLFHIANGESPLGEWFSAHYGADFSRILPSFIRLNRAAIVASVIFVAIAAGSLLGVRIRESRKRKAESREQMAAFRSPLSAFFAPLLIAGSCLLLAGLHHVAITPGTIVHFEDSHVRHRGGELYPHVWTVARFLFTGGWTLRPGDELEFRLRGGPSRLFYRAPVPTRLLIDGQTVILPASGERFVLIRMSLARADTHMMRCLAGEATLDRIEQK